MSDEFDEFEDDEELDEDEESEEPEGEPCPICKAPNHPLSDTRCAHNVAWTWDGQTEALGSADGFAQAWARLCNRVYEVEEDSADDARLQARALALPFGAQLVQLARQDANLADVLEQLAGATTSGGWSTDGMLGGSGTCLYVKDPTQLVALAEQCQVLCQAD